MNVSVYPIRAGPGLVHPTDATSPSPVSPSSLALRYRCSSLLTAEVVGAGSYRVPLTGDTAGCGG